MDAKTIGIIVACILAVYIIFGVFLFFWQSSMIYFPSNQDFHKCLAFEDYQKIEYGGTRFYFLKQNDSVIVFYHGNAGSACDRSYLKPILEPTGKSIVIVEYSGYSNDRRKPTRQLLMQDVNNVKSWLSDQGFNSVSVIGESIGTGAASYHAALGNVQQILLLSPFNSLLNIARFPTTLYPLWILMSENIDNAKLLQNYSGSVLIIHGSSDEIIDEGHARMLFESLQAKSKDFASIEGAHHNNLLSYGQARSKINEYLSE